MEKRLTILENVLFVAGGLSYWLLPPPWKYGGLALFAGGVTIAAVIFAGNLRELKSAKRTLEEAKRVVRESKKED